MRLSKPMLQIFPKIARGINTIEGLAKVQNKSPNWITEIVKDLENEGFVIKKRAHQIKGSRIFIEVASTMHAIRLKELIMEYPSFKFEDLFADSKILFLAAVSEDWIDIKTATELSKVSKYMLERYRSTLKNRGVITTQNHLYKINEKAWHSLREFVIAYKNYAQLNGVVRWKYQEEIIYEVDDEALIKDNATGLYEYKNYGVEVGVITALCIQPKRKLSKEEIFVHSLFEVDDPRTLHLALTFYLKNKLNARKVMPIAMKYGKYTMFSNFLKLLTTKEKKVFIQGLPAYERRDFIRIASMYGVKDVH